MENFFDIATPEELKGFFGETPTPEDIRIHRDLSLKNADYNFRHLYLMYCGRGDKEASLTLSFFWATQKIVESKISDLGLWDFSRSLFC